MLLVSGLASLFSCLKGFQTIEVSDRCFCRDLKHTSRSFHNLSSYFCFSSIPVVWLTQIQRCLPSLLYISTCEALWTHNSVQNVGKDHCKKQSSHKLEIFNFAINIVLGVLGVYFHLFQCTVPFRNRYDAVCLYVCVHAFLPTHHITHTHKHTHTKKEREKLQDAAAFLH